MKNINLKTSIGIIGGMGPQASAHLLKLIVDLSAKEFGAKNGDDFPEIVLISEPIDDFVSDKEKLKKAFRVLKDKIAIFDAAKIKKIAIACNTAHLLLPKLQETTSIPFVSMIEEVGVKVKDSKLKKIGIMGTPVTLRSGLYSKPLSNSNIRLILPSVSELNLIEDVIRKVLAGKVDKKDSKVLTKIALTLKKRGAEGIILGCTELPLVFPSDFNMPVFNSQEILARALLQKVNK